MKASKRTNCKIPFGIVTAMFREGDFDEYRFPCNQYEVLDFQYTLRHRIVEVFPNINLKNPNDYPSMYDISMLLFIYQTNNVEFETYTSWDNMKDTYTNTIHPHTPERLALIDEDDTIHCLCGHVINELFFIEDAGQYLMLGNSCIEKNEGHLAEELKRFKSYTCTVCDETHIKQKGHTIDVCARCVKYGPKIVCGKCRDTVRSNHPYLCTKCTKANMVCTIHPEVVMNSKKYVKGTDKCIKCSIEATRERAQETRECLLMFAEDPIRIYKVEQDRQRMLIFEEQLEKTTQKCVDCPTRIPKSTFLIRCKPCYYKTKPPKPMTLCTICKKSTGTDWKTKCSLCFRR